MSNLINFYLLITLIEQIGNYDIDRPLFSINRISRNIYIIPNYYSFLINKLCCNINYINIFNYINVFNIIFVQFYNFLCNLKQVIIYNWNNVDNLM